MVKMDEMRGTVQVTNPNAPSGEPPKSFTFDTVFAPGAKQTDVYNQTARPIVDAIIEGYNGRHLFCSTFVGWDWSDYLFGDHLA